MSLILTYASGKHVVKVGRLAGQFAKPRSEAMETKNGISLPSYRGDIINGIAFTPESREPNPENMVKAYQQSVQTMNLLRAFATGGMADLRLIHRWNLDFVQSAALEKYEQMALHVEQTLRFMAACGVQFSDNSSLSSVDFYVSHEALLLNYEEAMTRIDSLSGDYYDTSAHFVWVGDRTRSPDGAHIAFLAGISNPIGIKVGPSANPEEICTLMQLINPKKIKGKVVLISRMGATHALEKNKALIATVQKNKLPAVFCCDPMHGNVRKTQEGYKTRSYEDILAEIQSFFAAHSAMGSYAGGLHLEMTGHNVTECTGGVAAITDQQVGDIYTSTCDPRLNASQSLELAFAVGKLFAKMG